MEQVLSSSTEEKDKRSRAILLALSKERIFILGSVLFAFLLRVFFIPQNTVINGDGVYYATLGKKLISGDLSGGISAYWSPFYSLLVGISSLFFQDTEFAGRFVSVIAGALLIIPAYFLIRNLYGQLPAYFGIVLLTVHPLLIRSSGWVMTESLYTLIFTTGILLAWSALSEGKAKTFFITGLLFGLMYLTKPEALGFLGLLLILTLGAKFFHQAISFRRYLTGYLLILSGFTVFFLPYVIYLHQKTGQWTISQKIMVNLPAADYDGGLLKITDDGQITMQDRIWGDDYDTQSSQTATPPSDVPGEKGWAKVKSTVTILGAKGVTLLKKQIRDHIPVILPYFFVLIAVIGFFYTPWTKMRTAREIFLFSFFICTLIGYALSAIELRYLFPVIPILICWVANGIVEFSDWASKSLSNLLKTNPKISLLFVQILTLLVLIVSLVPLFLNQFKPDELQNVPFEEKQAGLWIKNHTDSSSPLLVMASNATVAFYAGAKHIYLPDEEFSTVLEYAKRRKIDYLIYSQRRTKYSSTPFSMNEQNPHPELRLVYQDEPEADYKIIVYQLAK